MGMRVHCSRGSFGPVLGLQLGSGQLGVGSTTNGRRQVPPCPPPGVRDAPRNGKANGGTATVVAAGSGQAHLCQWSRMTGFCAGETTGYGGAGRGEHDTSRDQSRKLSDRQRAWLVEFHLDRRGTRPLTAYRWAVELLVCCSADGHVRCWGLNADSATWPRIRVLRPQTISGGAANQMPASLTNALRSSPRSYTSASSVDALGGLIFR